MSYDRNTATTPVHALATLALATCLAQAGCGETKCKMDTECPLPQVCVSGACLQRMMDGVTDTTVDSIVPDGTDTPIEIPDGEDPDWDVEDTIEDSGPAGCDPNFPEGFGPRTILGGLGIATGTTDDADRAEQFVWDNPSGPASSNPQVWVSSRIVNGDGSPKLVFLMYNPSSGTVASGQSTVIGSITLEKYHPADKIGDKAITVFRDLSGIDSYKMLFIMLDYNSTSLSLTGLVQSFTNSDASSGQPALATSATEAMAIWRQEVSLDLSTINFTRIDIDGIELGSGTIAGSGAENLEVPVIVHNGTGYGVAWFAKLGVGLDRVDFVEIDSLGAQIVGTNKSWPVVASGNLKGRPSLEWNGSVYALVWEETDATEGYVKVSIIPTGGGASTDSSIETSLEETVGNVSSYQNGKLDLAWNGTTFGMIWAFANTSTSKENAWFTTIGTDATLVDTPIVINPSAANTHHPRIDWIETSLKHYHTFTWNEMTTSAISVLYSYPYGCQTP